MDGRKAFGVLEVIHAIIPGVTFRFGKSKMYLDRGI
jgi:hypothetical protein